jgi:small-conductance mechanosensitive channel
MRKVRQFLLATVFLFSSSLFGQAPAPEAPVRAEGRTLLVLHSGVGSFSAVERAHAVEQRLQDVLNSPTASHETSVQKTDLGLVVVMGDKPILSVTPGDEKAEKVTSEVLADRWARAIQEGMQHAKSEKASRGLWRRLLNAGIVLVLAVLAALLLRRGKNALGRWLEARRERIPTLHFRGLELVSRKSLYEGLGHFLAVISLALLLVIVAGALLLIFEQVPATQSYARQVFLWIWDPLAVIFWGVVGYLPNLFYILVIVFVTRFVMRGVGFIFEQAHRGVISLEPWVHRDVVRPTAQILKAVLIVLALFFIAPLIPGTGTSAAQAITVLLGLTVSLGSTSTVGNAIAGIVLTYMRPFQLGDRVQIGETTGDVVERTFLYTKVLTIKNEEVMVPSLQVISRAMINYSARAREAGLILHTSVTIGYDAPWRKVHELLLLAADRTANVLKNPKPFVLQTGLDDSYVSYQLNAYTDHPNEMAQIYAELHQNIQDSFNEGGVEIMSPHYYQLRDGNTTTVPADYRPQGYQADRFRVETRMAEAVK